MGEGDIGIFRQILPLELVLEWPIVSGLDGQSIDELGRRFHDLRHTFGSRQAMEGFNLRTIQQLLGHKDLRMTLRYSHLSAEHLQQAVNRLDAVMGGSDERSASQQQV